MYYNKKKLTLSIVWIVLGAALLALSIADVLDSSFYSGFGGGFLAVGVLQLIRNVKYGRNAEYREKVDVEQNDERNRFISMKTWSWTGLILILTFGIGVIVSLIIGQHMLQLFFAYSICFILLVYWITYLIVSRKY